MGRFREFFQDECGSLSMMRLMAFTMTMFYLLWGTVEVAKGKGIQDIPLQFAGLVTLLYLTNKAAPVLTDIFKKKEAEKPEKESQNDEKA